MTDRFPGGVPHNLHQQRGVEPSSPPATERAREIVCAELCASGKFETGQGGCAPICMEMLGCSRPRCSHKARVHGKLADEILAALSQPAPALIEEGEGKIARLRKFLQMVEDFGNMGTGEFRRKYPDCDSFEGYLYVQRKGRALKNSLRSTGGRDAG
jgi:hypothetical protein